MTSLACVGKKTVCKRRPFTRAAGLLDVKVFYFNLFIISFCFVYNFVGTMPILQTRMFFRGGRMLGDCEGKMRLYFLRVLFFVF